MLEMLESVGTCSFIHRDVYTSEEAEHLLTEWAKRRYEHWSVLYIATHGSRSTLHLGGKNDVSLGDLGNMLEGRCAGRVIYFGSCSVLRSRAESEEFLERTGASYVVGYRRDVDWVTSAAFEVALFGALGQYARAGDALNYIEREAPSSLARFLRFVRYPNNT